MTSEIAVFEKEEFGSVRTVWIDDKPYFCGKDIATALGYARSRDAISDHCKGAVKYRLGVVTGKKSDGSDAVQVVSMAFIPESDVIRLIIHSKLPSAEKFESWVFDEVLPTIIRTGKYEITKADKVGTELRKKSKEIRHKFTDTLKEHGYSKQYEYIQTTQQMKKSLGISKKKDEMSEKELLAISASELLTEFLLTDEQGFCEVNPVCIDATDEVKKLADKRDLLKITA